MRKVLSIFQAIVSLALYVTGIYTVTLTVEDRMRFLVAATPLLFMGAGYAWGAQAVVARVESRGGDGGHATVTGDGIARGGDGGGYES